MEHINFRELLSGTEANFKVIYEDSFSLSLPLSLPPPLSLSLPLYNDTVNIVFYFILLELET